MAIWAHAEFTRARSGRACSRAETSTQATARHTTPVRARLENSITPWMSMCDAGMKESASHEGHVGQPKPDPVTRTMPPVAMIRMLTRTAVKVDHRTDREFKVTRSASQDSGERGRGSPVIQGLASGVRPAAAASQ